jgi:hypothetical protein
VSVKTAAEAARFDATNGASAARLANMIEITIKEGLIIGYLNSWVNVLDCIPDYKRHSPYHEHKNSWNPPAVYLHFFCA